MPTNTSIWLGIGVVLLFIATPVAAFGAGDIVDVANIDGINYRHGDIENTLLELLIATSNNRKFRKIDVKRVYFGNWLRDYSQAIDVGGLKQLPAETIRILLWCLSFITFGFATGEFEVTAERLGCYRPEEHIDNPKDYADNEDARPYDSRLRGPVNEGLELKVDPETGLKTYIASENAGCDTSAALVRRLFEKSIELGRKYNREHNKPDFYEALRLLGTGLHCLEDFSAHSNYTELALRELGVDAFPHVGKRTEINVKGKTVFPIVTGTFGMTDFLHSVVGELGDKMAQSEVEEMESKLTKASADDEQNDQTSVIKQILDKVPWDLLEGDNAKPDPSKADELKAASASKAEETKQHPLDPNLTLGGVNIEEAKQMAQQTLKDMYPILEFHDQIMKGMNAITSKVPGLDDLLESLTGALQIFVFSLLSPYVTPIIAQARVELKSTSEGVLKSSEKGQYEVFENENSTDPTHSMLSKDHFSNVLNPIAGQIACATVKFVVPHIVEAWSDEGKDVRQVIDDILQVFHHPALRDENRQGQKAMFETVKAWWDGKNESEQQHLKEILSFDGVKEGKNHSGETTEGHGHSHGGKKKNQEAQEGATAISGIVGGFTSMVMEKTGLGEKINTLKSGVDQKRQQFIGSDDNSSQSNPSQSNPSQSYGGQSQHRLKEDNSSIDPYGQEKESRSSHGRAQKVEHSSYGRDTTENEPSYGQNTSSYGGSRNDDNETSSYGRKTESYGGSRNDDNETSSYGRKTESYGGSRNDDNETSSYGRKTESYGESRDDDNERSNRHGGSSYGRGSNQESSYGRGGNDEPSRDETSGYGGREESGYGGRGGNRRHEESNDNDESGSGYGNRRHRQDDDDNSRY